MSLMVEYKSLVSVEMYRTYADSVTYCSNSSKAGFTDWKIPLQANLRTILTIASRAVDPNNNYYLPNVNPDIFDYEASSSGANNRYHYWSSEEYDNDSQKTVYWLDGFSASVDSAKNGTFIKKSQTRIICVRDSI